MASWLTLQSPWHAKCLVLCAAGAAAGLYLADPFVTVMSQYAARFSVRALEVTVDSSVAWVGAGLAIAAAVLLAAAVVASWLPAARASRIDVIEALRSE